MRTMRVGVGAAGVLAVLAVSGCVIPGIGARDRSAGINGDFEVVRDGLPVNWIVSRYPLKGGDAEAVIDTTEAVSGSRSLKIVVHRYADADRWKPFVFLSIEAIEGATYDVSFWLKNRDCRLLMELGNEGKYHMFGGQSAEEQADYDAHPRIREFLGREETGHNEWRQFRYRYTVPETDGSLRFELKFLSTGTLWIDDVRIERVESPR